MVVFTNGCFDIIHVGHVKLLQACRQLADGLDHGRVIVGLNSDASVRRIKGNDRPINDQHARRFILESFKFVDCVHIFDEDTPEELIKRIRPRIIVMGGDYAIEQIVGRQYAEEIVIFPYVGGFSTTNIIAKTRSSDR
jgi:rfaE bifunctional protein nucleotidyltransferase chain/domain